MLVYYLCLPVKYTWNPKQEMNTRQTMNGRMTLFIFIHLFIYFLNVKNICEVAKYIHAWFEVEKKFGVD